MGDGKFRFFTHRMKTKALNIDKLTGAKHPANVPSVLCSCPVTGGSLLKPPNSTYPSGSAVASERLLLKRFESCWIIVDGACEFGFVMGIVSWSAPLTLLTFAASISSSVMIRNKESAKIRIRRFYFVVVDFDEEEMKNHQKNLFTPPQ